MALSPWTRHRLLAFMSDLMNLYRAQRAFSGPVTIFQEDIFNEPNVSVKLTDGRVEVTVSDLSLGKDDDLIYRLEFWETHSKEVQTRVFSAPVFLLSNLTPGAEYCLRAQVCDEELLNVGPFSQTECFETHNEESPRNLRILAIDTNYLLKWDWCYELHTNVTFSVQWASQLKSQQWQIYSGCENVTSPECNVSGVYIYGTYDFRVLAREEHENDSFSKTITFSPIQDTVIGPPTDLKVAVVENKIKIAVNNPEGLKYKALYTDCVWSYHLMLWKNSSDKQEEHLNEKRPFFTVESVEPATNYCFQVQVVCVEDNRTGLFSETRCITTDPDHIYFWWTWGILVVLLLLVIISVAVYMCVCPLQRYIKHIFYPSGKLPSSIEKTILGSPFNTMNNHLLLREEEITEICCIIRQEEDLEQLDRKPPDMNGRDSGNYSNEDDNTGKSDLCTQ
ncbi:interferon alpha/beta receptor 1-like [Pelodytes ibericus]